MKQIGDERLAVMMLVMMVSVCPHANIDVEAKSKAVEKDWGQIYFDFICSNIIKKFNKFFNYKDLFN